MKRKTLILSLAFAALAVVFWLINSSSKNVGDEIEIDEKLAFKSGEPVPSPHSSSTVDKELGSKTANSEVSIASEAKVDVFTATDETASNEDKTPDSDLEHERYQDLPEIVQERFEADLRAFSQISEQVVIQDVSCGTDSCSFTASSQEGKSPNHQMAIFSFVSAHPEYGTNFKFNESKTVPKGTDFTLSLRKI